MNTFNLIEFGRLGYMRSENNQQYKNPILKKKTINIEFIRFKMLTVFYFHSSLWPISIRVPPSHDKRKHTCRSLMNVRKFLNLKSNAISIRPETMLQEKSNLTLTFIYLFAANRYIRMTLADPKYFTRITKRVVISGISLTNTGGLKH